MTSKIFLGSILISVLFLTYLLYRGQKENKKRRRLIQSKIHLYSDDRNQEIESQEVSVRLVVWVMAVVSVLFTMETFLGFYKTFALVCLGGVFYYFNQEHKKNKKRKEFVEALPQALDSMARGLKSGLSLPQAMEVVRTQTFGSVSNEIGYVLDSLKLGITFKEALEKSAQRIPIREYQFLTLSLLIQQETGGSLVDLLTSLKDSLRQKHFMAQKMRALSSQTRTSALVLASLPFVSFGGIFLLNPDYISTFLQDPRGRYMGGAALFLLFCGLITIRQLMKFDE